MSKERSPISNERLRQKMLSLWRDLARGTKYDIERTLKRESRGRELWELICSELAWALVCEEDIAKRSERPVDKRDAGGDYQDNCVHDLTRSKTCKKCGWSP